MSPRLSINRAEFIRALRTVRKSATPQPGEEAVLGYADGAFTITVTGMRAAVGAEGAWPGEARVAAKPFLESGRALPRSECVEISVQGEVLAVGVLRLQCRWQEAGWRVPLIPRNPTLRQLLRLAYEAFPREIEASGLHDTLAKAREERDTLIQRAGAILAPLGVTFDDLLPVVESCLLRDEDR